MDKKFVIKPLVTFLVIIFGIHIITFGQNNVNETPYKVITNHLNFMDSRSYVPQKAAASFHPNFDLRVREDLAKKLQHIYDGYGLTFANKVIPKNSNWIDSLSGKHVFEPFPTRYPEILVTKYGNDWYYAIETAEFIEITYAKMFPAWADELINLFPTIAPKKIFGIAIWQYLTLFIILAILALFHFLLSWLVNRVLNKSIWESLHINQENHKTLYKLAKLLSVNILLIVLKKLLPILALNSSLTSGLVTFIDMSQTFLIAWGAFQLIIILKIYLLMLAEKTATKMDDQLIPLLAKALKLIIAIIALIHFLSLIGVNVTALIAGASIGGLALALAAQDTFKNLFGSVMVFMDKPFSIGDYITTSEVEGTVEQVGFRSTKIRKVDTSVISVPNGNIANVTITNLGIRKFRLVELTINLMYNTSLEKLETYVAALRTMTSKYKAIQEGTSLIYVRYLSASSIDVYFRVYIEAKDIKEELILREQMIFDIMSNAKQVGVSFAFPSTSIYVEQMPTKD